MSHLHQPPQFDTASRPNEKMARIVDAGIAYITTHGRDFAAAYMKRNGVNFNVVMRVMNEPQHRRNVKKPQFADVEQPFRFSR